MSKISLIKGKRRYQNVFKSLKLIEDDIEKEISGKKKIVIKPNFVSSSNQLAATHKDSVRAILDIISQFTDRKIIIAESAAIGSAMDGFKNYDYFSLKDSYNVDFVDLDQESYQEVEIYDRNMKKMKVEISSLLVEADFRISPAMLKTHNVVVATLSLKNLAVGSMKNKSKIHQGYLAINKSIAKLSEFVAPHLSVIDGFLGMQGDGPVRGDSIESNMALSGLNFLDVDRLAAYLMGFNPNDIGYLYHCKKREGKTDFNLDNLKVLGNINPKKARIRFKTHRSYKEQLNWKDE